MDRTDFLRQMSELFDVEEGSLELSSVIEDTPGWSSLTFLGLISVIDESYQTTIKPRQLNAMSPRLVNCMNSWSRAM